MASLQDDSVGVATALSPVGAGHFKFYHTTSIVGLGLVVANQEYKGHIISVSVIYDTYSRYQFTPVIDIRLAESSQVLNTILTRQAFNTIENANEFGFALVREWVDEETPSSED